MQSTRGRFHFTAASAAMILILAGGILSQNRAGASPALVQGGSSEKDSRTPAQRKINSQVLYEIYRVRGQAAVKHVPPGATGVRIDAKGRAFVDVRAEVTRALQRRVVALGGTITSVSKEYRSIIAWVPLRRLETLAKERAVRAIEPAAEAAIRRLSSSPSRQRSPVLLRKGLSI
jgi:hypothetical protein